MDVLTAVPGRSPTGTVKYTKSKWADAFTSFSLDTQVQEKYAKAIVGLKEEARSMLLATGNTTSDALVLIDTLERLGVAYHFDEEIEGQLEQIFKEDEEDGADLFITSLRFRLLRQHRYHASSGVFNKFKCQDNKFRETLDIDAKGLLSLYEAAHLRIHGEEILDEAVAFTVHHLRRMVKLKQLDSPLQDQVQRALEVLPLHRGSPKIEIRHYISLYEKDNSRNEILLKLAKLDFNYVQNMYKKELCELSRWWYELKSEVPYARSRVVESYLWATTYYFKPQYSYARVGVAKMCQMLLVLDDTYDNYATVEEADLFTESLQRLILRVYDDYEREAAEGGKQFAVNYTKETLKEVCKSYNKELKWFTGSLQMPSFEDYIKNAEKSGCFYTIITGPILGMTSFSNETIDWLRSEPKIVKAAVMVGRYLDNVSGYERERKNGQAVTGMEIYMTQHDVSMQETADKFIELVEDAWKDLNTEWVGIDSMIPNDVLDTVVGYARSAETFYRSGEDGYARAEVLGPLISALYVDPIPI